MSGRFVRVIAALALGLQFALPVLSFAISATSWDPYFASPTTIAAFGGAARPFGIAAGDFDGDGKVDVVVGRVTGNIAFVKGNGDGTFAVPSVYSWKQAFFNAWAFATGDVDGDGKLDIIWGANANSPTTAPFSVNTGDVRVFYGNGDGTFVQNPYYVSGVLHNAGTLLARVGTTYAGSLAVGDIDNDGDIDVVAGAIDGANTVVKILRNSAGGSFTLETVISQPATTALSTPIYYPAISTRNSPWGLSLSDADGDGDLDLWVGDRALYVYLYKNDGHGMFTLQTPNSAVADRPNVYLGHDSARAGVGYTPSLASGDINGDGKADLVLGLQSDAQLPASNVVHDGEILLDLSINSGHIRVGSLADIGTMARGMTVIDVNGDGILDIIGAEYDGQVKLLRQLFPLDSDGDGISDYVDNAPSIPNAARLDMNTDGSITFRDQLDNDFDTVLGNPENPATWQRLGDPADPDDDGDGIVDAADNCPFVANGDQADRDSDGIGDSCDPLDNRDGDGDGVPDGPRPGDAFYDATRSAAIKWSSGTTHFLIRIDALGRFFQNEFTQLLADAATLSPADWATKCWQDYGAGDPPEPCGTGEGTPEQAITLPGGKEVPVTLAVIPKQLWTDPEVVVWINDRNNNPRLEIAQHGTYHVDNVPVSDWRDLADRNFFSCETCGLSESEAFELMKVGYDTLVGNYGNKWIAESGATGGSAKIDWATSAHPLLSFVPPYDTSDTVAREAIAQLGFKGFSASFYEEADPYAGPIFTPEGTHHERFDQFGMFHASADLQLQPPDTTGDTYDIAAYNGYLNSKTTLGSLNTWLIEEVDWSGRPCNNADRLGTCNGGSNREDNTVYLPRWNAWMQVLDFVKSYPNGVVMTLDEVALEKGYDNAPTVPNPDQLDGDHDGIGDVIDGASLSAAGGTLTRNQLSALSATLTNGAGNAIAGQTLVFKLDANNDGSQETYSGITGSNGTATVQIKATRPVGPASYSVSWDGIRLQATANGNVTIADASSLTIDPASPSTGQVTDPVVVGATLADSDGAPLPGRLVSFTIASSVATGTTNANGYTTGTLTLTGPAGPAQLTASFGGEALYPPAVAQAAFTVLRENAQVTYAGDTLVKVGSPVELKATVAEASDGSLGDITKAKVVFDAKAAIGGGTTTYGPAPVSASGEANWTLSGGMAADVYDIDAHLDPANGYYEGPPADTVALVVYDPSAGFTVGGGWVMDEGRKGNFGFSVKYVGKQDNAQGQFLYMYHHEGSYIRLKANAMQWMVVNSSTAVFRGKATVNDVGNYAFEVTVVDKSESGNSDTFAIKVWQPNGTLLHELPPITLGGGNVQVPSPKSR